MLWTRRRFIKSASALTLTPALPSFAGPVIAGDGFLEITAGPSKHKLFRDDGPSSDLWTYNGKAPGPEIRVKRGERVRVRFINNLEEPSSIHWHGIRIANAMDGVAGLTQEAVPTGGSFDYDFVAPDAGTYWYHAHNRNWNQVARGLYGPLIGNAYRCSSRNGTTSINSGRKARYDTSKKIPCAFASRLQSWWQTSGIMAV